MQVLNYETLFSAYNVFCYFLYNVFITLCFIPSLKVVFIHAKRHLKTEQMGNSTNLAEKIEHAQFTVQDCARLPCKIARQPLCNIATCRITCKVLHGFSVGYCFGK